MKSKILRPLSEINITNLVDVTLVLLIIFMITAPIMQSGIKVNLPQTQHTEEVISEGVMISYTGNGEIFINGVKVEDRQFESHLAKIWAQSGRKPVMLSADQAIPYGKVIKIVDRIKSLGIENLGLVVENVKNVK